MCLVFKQISSIPQPPVCSAARGTCPPVAILPWVSSTTKTKTLSRIAVASLESLTVSTVECRSLGEVDKEEFVEKKRTCQRQVVRCWSHSAPAQSPT